MITLETDRLIIRDNILEDFEDHHRLMSDPDIMSYLQDIQTHSKEESLENLKFSIEESNKDKRQCYFFAMVEKLTGDYVGSIGFTIVDLEEEKGKAEIGYFIHKEFWGKGYTTEATGRIIEFAFSDLKLHKLTIGCTEENSNSEKIMIKRGFRKEAHLVEHTYHNGQWKDRVVYGMLRREWEKDKQ